jgi:uncharacterized protein (TIGR02453 family)
MTEAFAGFSPDFFAFFRELAANNDREWFAENKERYRDDVVAPISAFIAAMAPRLAAISPHYVADPRPSGGSMFRIYRDVRFSKDTRPYKENAGCQFRHAAGRYAHAPGFYVHLARDEVFFGGGIWQPPGPELQKIRRAIADRPDAWQAMLDDRAFKARFDGVHGDGLKRPPQGFAADHPHIADLKRKTFFAMRAAAPDDAMSPAFVDEVTTTFQVATPLMRFVCGALDVPF